MNTLASLSDREKTHRLLQAAALAEMEGAHAVAELTADDYRRARRGILSRVVRFAVEAFIGKKGIRRV